MTDNELGKLWEQAQRVCRGGLGLGLAHYVFPALIVAKAIEDLAITIDPKDVASAINKFNDDLDEKTISVTGEDIS